MRRQVRQALVAVLISVSAALAGCTPDKPAEDPFAAFVAGWQKADFTGVELRTPGGQPLAADAAKRLLADTEGRLAARRPTITRPAAATVRKNDAEAKAGVDWTLPDGRHWTYETALEARRIDGRWAVYFGPAVVHPDLPDGKGITLRQTDYAQIERDLDATDGVRTRTGKLSLPPTRTFGRALLGTSGPATKELIDGSGGALKDGDITGLTGLQRRYDTALRGTPRLEVLAGDQPGDKVLYTAPATDGIRVRTTIDVKTQQAAEAALAGTAKRSALVAVRVTDGAVLAVANGPDAAGYNLAFQAEVASPPIGVDAAAAGFGAGWRLGADLFTGRVTAAGVTGSPLVYAAAAAAVARGHWSQPVLVTEPSPGAPAADGPAVSGTVTVPGMSVGIRGDIAYCVYVEGAGQDVTGPIADAFGQSTVR